MQHNNIEVNHQSTNESLSTRQNLKQLVVPASFASVNLTKESSKLQITSLAFACIALAASVGTFIYTALDCLQSNNAKANVSSKIDAPSLDVQSRIDCKTF